MSQVCRLERERTIDGHKSVEVVYLVTSACRRRAPAERLLEVARDHWGAIENGLHWIRDEDFGEDRSPIVAGDAPQNLAAARNAVLNCLRILEVDNFAATLRSFARNPLRLLRIFGYPN